jgi:hypothetical protein
LYLILPVFANESLNNNDAVTCEALYKNLHQLASQRVPPAAQRLRSTRRSSEREPAGSLRDKSNVIGGWLPSLTFTFGPQDAMRHETDNSHH